MKSIIAVLVFGCSYCWAQIPNPGLEQWTSGNPDGWFANNIQGFAIPITQSAAAHSGSSAMHGEVVDVMGSAWPPEAIAGDYEELGFPVDERHTTLTGYYQFSPISGDRMTVGVTMHIDSVMIGGGYLEISDLASTYTEFSVPIEYYMEGNPNRCWIIISIYPAEDTAAHVGSFMLIDDLAFSGVTGIEQVDQSVPQQFLLNQNYPNPFNPETFISYQLPVSGYVKLSIYDLLGQKVAVLVDQHQQAGSYRARWDAAGLPSGTYVYRLESGGMVQSRKLLLLK